MIQRKRKTVRVSVDLLRRERDLAQSFNTVTRLFLRLAYS